MRTINDPKIINYSGKWYGGLNSTAIAAVALMAGFSPLVHATGYSWSGAQADNTWSKVSGGGSTNWNPNNGTFPGAGDGVTFGTHAATARLLVRLGTDRTVKSVLFNRNDSGNFLYKIDSQNANQNTLFIQDSLEVEKGKQEVYCHIGVQNSMSWIISDRSSEGIGFTDGELHLYGQLIGASDVVLTCEQGVAVDRGSIHLYNNSSTFNGAIVNEGVTFKYGPSAADALANAVFKQISPGGMTYWLGQHLKFRGLQFRGGRFQNSSE